MKKLSLALFAVLVSNFAQAHQPERARIVYWNYDNSEEGSMRFLEQDDTSVNALDVLALGNFCYQGPTADALNFLTTLIQRIPQKTGYSVEESVVRTLQTTNYKNNYLAAIVTLSRSAEKRVELIEVRDCN